MAKIKTPGPDPAAAAAPTGTFLYFLLKPDGKVLTSYGAGTSTLDALRETALAGGGALLVLKR